MIFQHKVHIQNIISLFVVNWPYVKHNDTFNPIPHPSSLPLEADGQGRGIECRRAERRAARMTLLFIGLSIGSFAGLGLGILLGLRIQRKYQAFLREVQLHRNTRVFSRYYITEEGILDSSKDYSEF